MKLVCFIAIELFFSAEFIYKNSFHLYVLHFRLFYIAILNKNGNEEKFYNYNSHSHRLYNHEMRRMWKSYQNKTNQI